MDATTQLLISNSSLDVNLAEHRNITSLNLNNYKFNASSNNNNNNNFSFKNLSSSTNSRHSRVAETGEVKRENGETIGITNEKSSSGGVGGGGGLGDDDNNNDEDYETEVPGPDYVSEGTDERMQLNPSTDLYDDNDDDVDEDDDYDDDETLYDDDEEPESLPDPKGLVQPVNEEEDMGYDEDDERIAMERPKTMRPAQNNDHEHFMNEEGSGAGFSSKRFKTSELSVGGARLSQLEIIRKKLLTEQKSASGGGGAKVSEDSEVDLRESSGNFANDDEDDDDDDDDGTDMGDDQSYEDNGGAGEPRAGFFNTKRKSTNHYFRKNTNDAIKIISTPLGKVGIVYQQTPTGAEEDKTRNGGEHGATADKKSSSSSFTDFDALSPDPESSHRLASSHPKITPVLTADGKVALLYRGDSESSKYEPIRNLTHKFSNNNKNNEHATDNKSSSSSSTSKIEGGSLGGADSVGAGDSTSDNDSSYADNEDDGIVGGIGGIGNENEPAKIDTDAAKETADGDADMPTDKNFIVRPTDSVLPMINRPLSEVLGIKKNQFKQIRVKDTLATTTSTEALPPRSLAGAGGGGGGSQPNEQHADTTTLHFLTKVNLADYPTSSRTTHNRDFDFSRDNTMLDERTRHREQQHNEATKPATAGITENSIGGHTIANEEILSKTEVVNLAIIPHFDDEDLERLQRLQHEGGGVGVGGVNSGRRHHRQRHRHKQTEEDLSGIHCVMQIMMGIAAISTVFGMLGTFFKQRILDQLRMLHW